MKMVNFRPVKKPNAECPIALWGVTWDHTNKKTLVVSRHGNRWTDKKHAERVYLEKEAQGLNPDATLTRCAGFAF